MEWLHLNLLNQILCIGTQNICVELYMHTSVLQFHMKLNSMMINANLFDHKICEQVAHKQSEGDTKRKRERESQESSVNCNEAPFIVVLICLALPTQITGVYGILVCAISVL